LGSKPNGVKNGLIHQDKPDDSRESTQSQACSKRARQTRSRQPLTASHAMPDIETVASKLMSFDGAADQRAGGIGLQQIVWRPLSLGREAGSESGRDRLRRMLLDI
jgi:hypothetical protein